MKIVLVFAAVLVVALAEKCMDNADCTSHAITSCSTNFNLVCHNNQCQCSHAPSGAMCTAQSDCSCDHGVAHCVDGKCHCARH